MARRSWRAAVLAIGLVGMSSSIGTAADWRGVEGTFPDTVVTDQNGQTHRFTDLIRDRVVAINFVFTECSTICGPQTALFRGLQTRAAASGVDVTLISVSIDPRRDTPGVLKAYARQFDAGPGWYFLTGSEDALRRLVRSLGVLAGDDPTAHAPVALIVNGKSGVWTRANSLSPAAELLGLVTEAGVQRVPSAPSAAGTRK